MTKRIIDGMSAKQIAGGCGAIVNRVELEDYLESLCKPEPNYEEYISRLERAVQVLANSNSDWEMNVSVWDTESILSVIDQADADIYNSSLDSILDDMSPQKLRNRMMNRPMQPAPMRRRGGDKK